jgi:hypothetical protein
MIDAEQHIRPGRAMVYLLLTGLLLSSVTFYWVHQFVMYLALPSGWSDFTTVVLDITSFYLILRLTVWWIRASEQQQITYWLQSTVGAR